MRDGRQAETANSIRRGVMRHLRQRGFAPICELTLADGRRADVAAMDNEGHILIVEIKSGPSDFNSDHKWQDYLAWCDSFYFAVNADMPVSLLPHALGLMVADEFGAEILREPERGTPLAPARRKSMILRIGQAAALRLHSALDPFSEG